MKFIIFTHVIILKFVSLIHRSEKCQNNIWSIVTPRPYRDLNTKYIIMCLLLLCLFTDNDDIITIKQNSMNTKSHYIQKYFIWLRHQNCLAFYSNKYDFLATIEVTINIVQSSNSMWLIHEQSVWPMTCYEHFWCYLHLICDS